MIGRRLAESYHTGPIALQLIAVGFGGFRDQGKDLGPERIGGRHYGFEHHSAADNLAAKGSDHSHGCDLPRHLVVIEIRGAASVHATVRQIKGAFGIVWKPSQDVLINCNNLIGLAADLCHSACKLHILILAVHAAKGVTGQRTGFSLAPRHDDPSIKPARERNADWLSALEIPWQAGGECFSQMAVVTLFVKRFLFFPFPRFEVKDFLLQLAVPNSPGRSRWQCVNSAEQRAILQDASASDIFA